MAAQIAQYAIVSNVSKIVLGRTNHFTMRPMYRSELLEKLTYMAPNLSLIHISKEETDYDGFDYAWNTCRVLWSGEAVRRFLRETGGTEGSETVKQEG